MSLRSEVVPLRSTGDEEEDGSALSNAWMDRDKDAGGGDRNSNGNNNGTNADDACGGGRVGILKVVPFASAVACFTAILCIGALVYGEDNEGIPKPTKCLAMFILVSILWATEAIPVWVTAMLVPILSIVLQIIGGTPAERTKKMLGSMGNPSVVLMMGGFSVAAAVAKYGLDRRLALYVIQNAGTSPPRFLLCIMSLSFFLCMWVNNVVAPVLVIMLLLPVIQLMPVQSRLPQCVLLGIAFACNIGGMTTPIASPQNAAALAALETQCKGEEGIGGGPVPCTVSFLAWTVAVVPLCCLYLLVVWAFLLFYLRPEIDRVPSLPPQRPIVFRWQHYYIITVSVITISLWCSGSFTTEIFGSLGTVGLIPFVSFFGVGILTKHDLHQMQWNVLLLLGGGAALGTSVHESGLLLQMGKFLSLLLHGQSLWLHFVVFSGFFLIFTNFLSHTVAAITLLPIVVQISRCELSAAASSLVVGCVMSCSAASALPVSSFPNLLTLAVTDVNSTPYLSSSSFRVPAIVLCFTVLLVGSSIGWAFNLAILPSC